MVRLGNDRTGSFRGLKSRSEHKVKPNGAVSLAELFSKLKIVRVPKRIA